MGKKMESVYHELSEYFVFDPQKYTLDEFFTDVKTFKDSFNVSFCLLFLMMKHSDKVSC
jgi:diaphanous 2